MPINIPVNLDFAERISEEIFLQFDGESEKSHSVNLHAYAKSLQGFNNAFIKINKDLLHLDIEITIISEEEGSFVSKLKYIGTIGAKTVLAYSALASILSFHGIQFNDVRNLSFNILTCAIDEIKISKGNNEYLEEIILKSNLPDNEKKRYLALLKNIDFRIALDDITLFLEIHEMSKLTITQNDESIVIQKHERPFFICQPEDNEMVETFSDIISITSISKTDIWRFRGKKINKEFNAQIDDKKFLDNIRTLSANKIFEIRLSVDITKTVVYIAGKKKPEPPTYRISNITEIKDVHMLPFLQNFNNDKINF